MKAILLKGPKELVLTDIPVPEIGDDEVLVEVKYCGICGSDIHSVPECTLYPAGTYLGHEFSGVLAKVGKNVKNWHAGDRVVANPLYVCGECFACLHGKFSQCDHAAEWAVGCASGIDYAGAFSKFVRVPVAEKRLYRLPDEVSFEEGALAEPLACSLHAIRVSNFKPRDLTMVMGAGMIGLGVIAHLKSAGAGLIVVTETVPKRADVARKMGADYVFNPREESNLKEKVWGLAGGRGVDIVFDCSGNATAFRSATDYLRKGGQIIIKGIIPQDTPVNLMSITFNEWQIIGSLCYYADEFPMVLEFLKRKAAPVKELITSTISMSDIIDKGFGAITRPGNSEIKIIVQPED